MRFAAGRAAFFVVALAGAMAPREPQRLSQFKGVGDNKLWEESTVGGWNAKARDFGARVKASLELIPVADLKPSAVMDADGVKDFRFLVTKGVIFSTNLPDSLDVLAKAPYSLGRNEFVRISLEDVNLALDELTRAAGPPTGMSPELFRQVVKLRSEGFLLRWDEEQRCTSLERWYEANAPKPQW